MSYAVYVGHIRAL